MARAAGTGPFTGRDALIVEALIGCTVPFGEQSRNIARNAWLQAGDPAEVPATVLDAGRFGREMVPLELDREVRAGDQTIRPQTTAESLSALKPVFRPDGRNGGATALGHQVGATGARLFGALLAEMERRDAETGLVTMCCGGGLGTAALGQRVA